MGDFLWVFFGLIAVSGLLYLVVTFVFGPGEESVRTPPDSAHLSLPAGRVMTAADVENLRLPVSFRGYRMGEVDALLDRLADELAIRDALGRTPQQPGGDEAPADSTTAISTREPGRHEADEPEPEDA